MRNSSPSAGKAVQRDVVPADELHDRAVFEEDIDVENFERQGVAACLPASGFKQFCSERVVPCQKLLVVGSDWPENGSRGDGSQDARLPDAGGAENCADFSAARTFDDHTLTAAQVAAMSGDEATQAAAFAMTYQVMFRRHFRSDSYIGKCCHDSPRVSPMI